MLKKLIQFKHNKGFTLIELIVVIAILGVLIAILVPSMLGFLDNAKKVSVKAEAKTILNGGQALAGEKALINNETITPDDITLEAIVDADLVDPNVLDNGELSDLTIDEGDGATITHFIWTHNGYQAEYTSANNPQWACQKVGAAG